MCDDVLSTPHINHDNGTLLYKKKNEPSLSECNSILCLAKRMRVGMYCALHIPFTYQHYEVKHISLYKREYTVFLFYTK